MQLENQKIVITGGASGIGLAIIQALQEKNIIISMDRNEAKRTKLKDRFPNVHTLPADVTQEEQLDNALRKIADKFGKIDILINNAGVGKALNFTDGVDPAAIAQQEMAVNYLAPIRLTKKALPLLKKSANPSVVFTTSGLALTPDAAHPTYSASKAALHSFVLSLRHQLRNTNIQVFELLPPTVDTDFTQNINTQKITPEKVAQDLVKGLKKGQHTIKVGQAKALGIIARITPSGAFKMLNPNR